MYTGIYICIQVYMHAMIFLLYSINIINIQNIYLKKYFHYKPMQQAHSVSSSKPKPYKIILVGSQAVGKSSILHRIIQSKFDANYSTTIGVDFKTINVPIAQKHILLQIWDTAGQQKFKALTQSYFKGSQGCICVFDINQKESLNRAQEYIKEAFQYSINTDCVFLLANKCDLVEGNSFEEQGRQLANSLDINFVRVSAKTGQGIGELLGNIAAKMDTFYGSKDNTNQNQANKRPTIKIDDNSNKKSCAC